MTFNSSDRPTQERTSGSTRLTLDFREERRRSRLHRVRRDVETVLRHPVTELDPDARAQMERAVAVLIAEIAILDRMLEPGEGKEYVELIGQTLDLDAAPSATLWMEVAPGPMASFAADWAAHAERATRLSEVRHQHRQLVDLDVFGPLFGLTRARVREIFGDLTCSIKPVKIRRDRFTPDESEFIRNVAKTLELTREYVGDVYQRGGREAVNSLVLAFTLTAGRPQDPGGRTKGSGRVGAGVEATKKAISRSRSTTYRRVAQDRAFCASTGLDSEVNDEAQQCGVTVTEVHLQRVAQYEQHRHRSRYPNKKLVIEWYTAIEGKGPTPGQMHNWRYRNIWIEKVREAKAWKVARELASRGIDCEISRNGVVIQQLRQRKDGGATGPLRPVASDIVAEAQESANAQSAPDGG